jgi:serine/threonine-protein kinase
MSLLSRWWAAVGFASVPGAPQEARAFVQRRIALYLGFMCAVWTAGWLGSFVLSWSSGTPSDILRRPEPAIHLGTCAVLFGLWLLLRRKNLGDFWLNVVDASGTKLQALVIAALLLFSEDVPLRPDLSLLLGLNTVLVTRATMVPSTPMRTFGFGAGASAILLLASYLAFRQHTLPGYPPGPLMFVLWDAMWCAILVATSTFITYVMYRLRRRMQEVVELGQYLLESRLGEGGMGIVYRARHALLRRPTAIKLLPPERAGRDAIARFEREVRVTSQLSHPNTVAIYDYGHTPDGVFYYAMEYLEGIDLETLVQSDGPQPPARVRHILKQIAEALREAHHVGVIHRDVKPANVMLCERGLLQDFVKVLDFGLVREISSEGASGSVTDVNVVMGTPLYMSPEQIRDPARSDGRSDLYALGAVGYFLLAGKPVFDGGNVVEVCAQHLHSVPPPLAERRGIHVPPKLEAVILRCLSKDPEDRPADAGALLDALAACDDVPSWSAEDARAWWQAHASSLREQPSSNEGSTVLTVELGEARAIDVQESMAPRAG